MGSFGTIVGKIRAFVGNLAANSNRPMYHCGGNTPVCCYVKEKDMEHYSVVEGNHVHRDARIGTSKAIRPAVSGLDV